MPPKRRTSGTAPKSQQSTLAFHGAANKVTKAGTRAPSAKKNLISEPIVKDIKPEVDELDTADEAQPTTVEAAIIEQTEQEVAAQKVALTPEEVTAKRITDARIKKYWLARGGKNEKLKVHQKDLSMHEKILREFDMSGQYGVSTIPPNGHHEYIATDSALI